ncbi:MAG: hypothetical protein ACRECT_08270 [Thermoplasmata archaeon]
MDNWSLGAGAVALAVLPVYLYVGERLRRRPVPASAQLASSQFVVWWWGIGLAGASSGVEAILWAFGVLTLPTAITFQVLVVILDCVFLWGLLGYLTYIYTGRNRLVPWSVFYIAFFVVTLNYEFTLQPIGVSAPRGAPQLVFAHVAVLGDPVVIYVLFGLLVPEIAGLVLYFTLFFRTHDRTLRYRIGLVTLSLALWFGVTFYTPPSSAILPQLWTLLSAIIEASASLIALLAYFPPEGVQRRFRIGSLSNSEERPEGRPASE